MAYGSKRKTTLNSLGSRPGIRLARQAVLAGYVLNDKALAGVIGNGWDGVGKGAATVYFNIVGSGTPDLLNEDDIIIAALNEWVTSASVDITFKEAPKAGLADSIDFYFTEGLGAPYYYKSDGVLGNLGYGYYPDDINYGPLAGDIIFDEAETWLGNMYGPGHCGQTGCDLYYVALHEIGHALGLTHAKDNANSMPGGVMNPFFNPIGRFPPGFGNYYSLQESDIANICSLYSCTGAGSVQLLSEVPLPATGLLFLTGFAALLGIRKMKALFSPVGRVRTVC